ncbi:hypothetical protein JOD51_001996 [Curtobacterium herbarum]|nr:hypothetical protein [Curtobacterium herbarum]
MRVSAATARTAWDGRCRRTTTSDASAITVAPTTTRPAVAGTPTSTATTIHVAATGPASRRSASDARTALPSAAPDAVRAAADTTGALTPSPGPAGRRTGPPRCR